MKLVFYADRNRGTGKQLWKLNSQLELQYQGTFHETIKELTHSLTQPRDDFNIVILLAACLEDLWNFISIKKLLLDCRVILIVPDRDKETVSMGHKLHPRFLSYSDSDLNDVALVLNNMIRSLNQKLLLQKPVREAQNGH